MCRGRLTEAREYYQKALTLDPNLGTAHRSLGQFLLALDDPRAALEHLERTVELAPQDGATFATLARAYARIGDHQQAAAAAEKSGLGSTLSLPDQVLFDVESLGITSKQCYERAIGLMRQGQYAQAIEQLKITEEQRREDPDVHSRLGISYARTGQSTAAVEHLSKALRLNDDLVDAHVQLAGLLARSGQTDQALQHYRRAIALAPDDAALAVNVATSLARAGSLDDAIALFELAASIQAPTAQMHMNWGGALMQAGRVAEAIEHYREALRLNPNYALAHYNLGRALEGLGRTDEAISHYRTAASIDPSNPARRRLQQLGVRPP